MGDENASHFKLRMKLFSAVVALFKWLNDIFEHNFVEVCPFKSGFKEYHIFLINAHFLTNIPFL